MAVFFLYGVKSPESKRQYPRRFKMFLDFLHLPGDLQRDQAQGFINEMQKANILSGVQIVTLLSS